MYNPSKIIDSAWKLLIQNNKIYREFCIELWGSFIDKIDPNNRQNWLKYYCLYQYFTDYNSYFKKYDPLHEYDYNEKYLLFTAKHFVKVKKDNLRIIINYIDDSLIDQSITKTDQILNLWDEVHNKIIINNANAVIVKETDHELIVGSILDTKKYSSYPQIFMKLLSVEFDQNLLSAFEETYCLSNSDAILIMVEYLKFLTICKIYNESFSPSSWVDQFWHHHMSYDTKHYREFWENLFGVEVEHHEHDPSSMSQEEKLILIEKSKRFTEVYIEWFGEAPQEWVWPELTLDSWNNMNDEFVSIDIYKTILMKLFTKSSNFLTFSEESKNELNKQNKKQSFFKSIANLFKGSGYMKKYKPAKDSKEDLIIKGKLKYDNLEDKALNTLDLSQWRIKYFKFKNDLGK